MTRFAPSRPDVLPDYREPTLSPADADWRRFLYRKRMVDVVSGLSPIGEETEPEDVFTRRRLEEIARTSVGEQPTSMGTPEDPEQLVDMEAERGPAAPPAQRSWAHQYLANVEADKAASLRTIEEQRAAISGKDPAEYAQRAGEYLESGAHPRASARGMQETGWKADVLIPAMLEDLEGNIQVSLDEGDFERAGRLRFAKQQLIRYGPNIDPNGPEVKWTDRYVSDLLASEASDMSGGERFRMAIANGVVDSARMIRRFAGAQNPGDRDIMELTAQAIEAESPTTAMLGGFIGSALDPGWYLVGGALAKGGAKVMAGVGGEVKARFAQALVRQGKPLAVAESAAARLTPEKQAIWRLGNFARAATAKATGGAVSLSESHAQAIGSILYRSFEGAIGNAAIEAGISRSKGESLEATLAAMGKGAAAGLAFGAAFDRIAAGISSGAKAIGRIGDLDLSPSMKENLAGEIDAARRLGVPDQELDTLRDTMVGAFREANDAQRLAGRPLTEPELAAILANRGVGTTYRQALGEQTFRLKQEEIARQELAEAERLAGGREYVDRLGAMEQGDLELELRGLRTVRRTLSERPVQEPRAPRSSGPDVPGGSNTPYPPARSELEVRRAQSVKVVEGKIKVAEELYRRRFGAEAPAGERLSPTLPDGPEAAQARMAEIEDRLFGADIAENERASMVHEYEKLRSQLASPMDEAAAAPLRARLAELGKVLAPEVPARERIALIDEYEAIRAEYPTAETRSERAARNKREAEANTARPAPQAPPTVATTGAASQTALGDLGKGGKFSKADVLTYISSFGEKADALEPLIADEPHVIADVPIDALELQLIAGDEKASLASGELSADKLEAARDFPHESMPPIVGRVEGGKLLVLDGTHRAYVAKERGRTSVQALVPESEAQANGWTRLGPTSEKSSTPDPTPASAAKGARTFAPEDTARLNAALVGVDFGMSRFQATRLDEGGQAWILKLAPRQKFPTDVVRAALGREGFTLTRKPGAREIRVEKTAEPVGAPPPDDMPTVQAATPAPAGEPIPDPRRGFKGFTKVEGRTGTLELPDGRSVPVQYRVVESGYLVPSHNAKRGFQRNPAGDVNERDYADPTEGAASRETVHRIADEPKTDLLLTDTPVATDGPPVTRWSGVVLGGNARTMALQLMYERNGPQAKAYRDALLDRAEAFGINRADVEAISDPILVRMVEDEYAGGPGEMSRALNQPLTTGKTADTDAVSRGRALKPEDTESIASIIGDRTLREALGDPVSANRILQRLVDSGAFSGVDLVSLVNSKGVFTAAGKDAAERTLLGAAVPDVRRISQTSPAVRQKLIRALPAITRLRAVGSRVANLDFPTDLGDALDAAYALRESGAISFEDLVRQSSAFDEPWRRNARSIGLARSLVEDTPTKFASKLEDLAAAAEGEATGQGALFGTAAQATADTYARHFPAGDLAKLASDTGGALFDRPEMAGSRGASPYAQSLPIMLGSASGALQRVPPVLRAVPMPELFKLAKALLAREPKVRALRGARGMFKYQPGDLSTAQIIIDPATAADPSGLAGTLAHEIGHLIDYLPDGEIRRGNLIGRVKSLVPTINALGTVRGFMVDHFAGLSDPELRKELIDLSQYWKPWTEGINPNYDAYRKSSVELYADALSVWLNSPGLFEQRAPKFAKALYEGMDAKPAVRDAYLSVQDLLAGTPAEIANARRADIREGFAKGEEILQARAAEKDDGKQSLIASIRQLLLDRGAPIYDRGKAWRRRGIPTADSLAAEYALDELNYRDAATHLWLSQVERDVSAPLLELGVDLEDIGEYLLLRRIATERAEIANPWGHVPETALQQITDIATRLGRKKTDQLDKSVRRFDDLVFQVAEEATDSGIISRSTFDTKIAPNKGNYATFAVLDYLELNMSPTVKQQVGTFKQVANPFTATVLKAMSQIRAVQLNNAKAEIRDLFLKHAPTDMVKKFTEPGQQPAHPGAYRDHLVIMEGGRPVFYETDAYTAKAFSINDIGLLSRIGKAIGGATYKVFHPLYVTLSPSWQITNLPRDVRRTHKNLPIIQAYASGKKSPSFREVLKAYAEASGTAWKRAKGEPDPIIDAMLEARALDVPYASFDWTADAAAYDNLLARYGLGDVQKARGAIGRFLDSTFAGVERIGVWTESLPKVATWNMLQRRGMDTRATAHVVRNHVGTPNFKKKGLATELTNGLFMYSNVVLQGLRADAHVATNPKSASGYWMRSLMLDFAPKVAMRAAAAGAFGLGVKAIFDLIPSYDLANYVVVPLGTYTTQDGTTKAAYLRLPHDDANRMLAIAMWLLSEGKTSEAIEGVMGQLPFGQLSPPLDIAMTWGQYVSGTNPRDTFRHRDIVGQDAWKAGGWWSARDMVRWTLDEFGIASVVADGMAGIAKGVGKAVGVNTEPVTQVFVEPGREITPMWWERVIGGLPGIERILKISDRGITERAWEDVALEDAEAARFRLSLPQNVRQFVRERSRLNRLGQERLRGPELYRRQALNDFYRRAYLPITKAMKTAEDAGDDRRVASLRRALEEEANRVRAHLAGGTGRDGDPAGGNGGAGD